MLLEEISINALNNCYKVTKRIDNRVRTALVFLCLLSMTALFSFAPQSVQDGKRMVFGTVQMLLITIFSLDKEVGSIRWNKYVTLPIELFAIGLINISFIHPIGAGYVLFALDILFLFPSLYLVWINRGDFDKLYSLTAIAVIIAGISSYGYTIVQVLLGGEVVVNGRFAGTLGNPNYYAMMGLAVLLSSLYFMISKDANVIMISLLSMCAGIGLSMVIVTASRTAIISVALTSALIPVCMFRSRNSMKNLEKGGILRFILIVLLIVIGCSTSLLIQSKGYAPREERISFLQSELVYVVHAEEGDDYSGDEGISEENKEENKTLSNRLSIDKDINSFSSGRIRIWNQYISYLNMLGHDYESMTQEMYDRAHNNVIDFAFRCGMPVSAMYLLFYLSVIVGSLKLVFSKSQVGQISFWIAALTMAYATYALFEISTLPFIRYIPFLFFISIAPLMGNRKECDV